MSDINQTLKALEVANEIIQSLIPMQIKYGAGIGPKEQADLKLITDAIKRLKQKK